MTRPAANAITAAAKLTLKLGTELKVGVDFVVKVDRASAAHLESDLRQIIDDLGLAGSVRIEFQ